MWHVLLPAELFHCLPLHGFWNSKHKIELQPGVMVRAYNPGTWEDRKRIRSSRPGWQLGLYETLTQTNDHKNELYLPARLSGLYTRGPLDPLESELQTFVSCHAVQEQSHCF